MPTYSTTKFKTVEEYMSTLAEGIRLRAEQLRETIRKTAPGAEEVISYNMPAFKWNGMLVWFAAYNHHLGFYPKPSAIRAFKTELAGYACSTGAVQFPLDRPLPMGLVVRMVKFRMKENEASAGAAKGAAPRASKAGASRTAKAGKK